MFKSIHCLYSLAVVILLLTSCDKPKDASPEALANFENVIPKPVSATTTGKAFFINERTRIVLASPSSEVAAVGNYIAEKLAPAVGKNLSVETGEDKVEKNTILFTLVSDSTLRNEEGYILSISSDQVRIAASKPAGLYFGVQTLRQLLPVEIESGKKVSDELEIATGTITDYPDFGWRGSMLDVARHFFSVEDVKRYIDLISLYKINTLHLHLSDDQGWRIEIKSWPNLATHGGSTQVGGGKGGYYTQEQYKEIVAYAAARYMTIIPEIDLPGHINAALASYGELNGGITIVPEAGRINLNKKDAILDGKPKPTELYTGTEVGFSTLQFNRPETFVFVEDVIKELAAITPGKYLHIGGDEAKVTKKEDYIRFINRFKEIVEKHGKKMVGWEEIAQGTLDSSVVVQHWHSDKYAVMAAEKGAKVLMSPATKVYLDMKYDSTTVLGLKWAAYIEVQDSYNWNYENIAEGFSKSNVVGVEAPLWGETIVTMDDIEFLLFPRIASIAEVGWTSTEQRDWNTFKVHLGAHGKRWDIMGINYYKSKQVPWETN